jgi:hypothetical protein
MQWLMMRRLAIRPACRYRSADPPKSPLSNDATLRLTNNFNSKFLVFAAAHHRCNKVGRAPPSVFPTQISRALLCNSQGGQMFQPITSGRKTMIRLFTFATAAGFAALTGINAFAADPLPTETHKVLTADLAVEAAQAAIAACKAQGYGVSVVVAGRDGMPKVVIVRDGPRGVGPEVARRKAYTAAMQRVSTGDFTKRVSTPGAFNPGMFDK